MYFTRQILFILAGALLGLPGLSQALEVKITPEIESVEVLHQGRPIVIQRNQDKTHTLAKEYIKTSRPCPPFCIQPMHLGDGVETVGELEVLHYLEQAGWGEPVLVIDSRTPNWVGQGTIPGTINLPWTRLSLEGGGNALDIGQIISEHFGVKEDEGLWDFSDAKTLVLFCNGPWCGQSSAAIRTLLQYGYPAHKLKWYRGGMQSWESFGLSTVKD